MEKPPDTGIMNMGSGRTPRPRKEHMRKDLPGSHPGQSSFSAPADKSEALSPAAGIPVDGRFSFVYSKTAAADHRDPRLLFFCPV
jgi:hypothetical protein